MIETISNNCQEVIQYISRSEFHNLVYVSFAIILTSILFALIKAIAVLRNSKNTVDKLSKYVGYPAGFKPLLGELNLKDKVVVFNSRQLSAFCYGIRDPKIYISSSMLKKTSVSELKSVLKHEQYHLMHHDSIIMLAMHLANHIFGLLPGFAGIIQSLQINREIKADRYAASYLGNKKPLLSVIRKILEQKHDDTVFAPAIGKYETLEPRILFLTGKNYKSHRVNAFQIVFSILTILIVSLTLVLPLYAHETHNTKNATAFLCPGATTQNASYPYTPIK